MTIRLSERLRARLIRRGLEEFPILRSSKRIVFGTLAMLTLLSVALVGCSGSSDTQSGQRDVGGKQPVKVIVRLSDFHIQSSLIDFEKGVPYHFVVKNDGKVPHEFMVMQPMQPKQLGKMTMSQMDKIAIGHIEEEDLAPGKTAEMDLTFEGPLLREHLSSPVTLPATTKRDSTLLWPSETTPEGIA